MLPKAKRIPRKLFKPIIEEGKHYHSPHFSLRVAKTEHEPRFAVSVSKKTAKKAVDRNRARRRTYSALRDVSAPQGLYLLSAKPGAEKLKGEVLQKELKNLFSKI